MRISDIFMAFLIALLGLLIIYPLIMVIYGSLKTGGPFIASPFSLQGYINAFSNVVTYRTLWTTIWLALVRAFLCLAVAVGLAWVVTRTDTPWRRFLEVAIWMTFFLPFQPYVMAWVLLLGGKSGIINAALINIFPWLKSAPLDVYSYGGIIWVAMLKFPSIIFLLITPAFRGMDASLEESSRMSGASTFTTLRCVTLPLLAPALLGAFLYALIRTMESFEIEMYLGYSSGIFVYTTRVYNLIGFAPSDYPQGMALSSIFLIIIMGLILLQWRMLGRKEFTTVTGRGFSTRPSQLGRLKYLTLAFLLLYVFIAMILPLGTMIVGSLLKSLHYFRGDDPWTLLHWQRVFDDARVWHSLKNSLVIGLGAATLGMAAYSMVTYVIIKTKFRWRKIVDVITWLPWGMPGMVLSLGLLWAYIGGFIPMKFLYGTIWLMILVLVVIHFPFGCRVMTGSLIQLSKELEESSRVHGASWLQTFRHIIVPILRPSFFSAWIVIFIVALKDLDSIIFLYGPKTMPVSALIFDFWINEDEVEKAVVVGVILSFVVLAFALIGRLIGARHWE